MDNVEQLIVSVRPDMPTARPAVLAALDEMNAAIAATSSRRERRFPQRVRTIAVVAIACSAMAGTAATAAVIGARTGWFTQVTSEQDGTEWLNTDAEDFAAEVAQLAPDYVTYPPGVSVVDAAGWVANASTVSGGLVQETGVIRGYETFGQCAWVTRWRDESAGSPGRIEATAHIARSVAWPALVATDGGGIGAAMADLSRAASDGDVSGVMHAAQILCPSDLLERR